MASGPYEQVLERLGDLDARLAGLQVAYSETNATAAQEHVAELETVFENEPDDLVALREAVDRLVETEDTDHAQAAKEHADRLTRRVEEQLEES